MANTSITEFGGYEDEINALNKKIEELETKLKSLKHTMETLKSSDLGMVGLMSQFNEYKDQNCSFFITIDESLTNFIQDMS